MDKIILKELEIYAFHGVVQEEKALGQKFFLTVELQLNLEEAAINDDLNKTVHYGILADEIVETFTARKFDLIEAAAMAVIRMILNKYKDVQAVKVLLKKPQAPIQKSLEYAAIEIERRRDQFNER